MNKLKENWRQFLMLVVPLIIAAKFLFEVKFPPLNIIIYSILFTAVIGAIYKSCYTQYCYYIVALIMVFLQFSLLMVWLADLAQGRLVTIFLYQEVISTLVLFLVSSLLSILPFFLLGVAARVFFDKPIKNPSVKIFFNFLIALVFACVLVELVMYFISPLSAVLIAPMNWYMANKIELKEAIFLVPIINFGVITIALTLPVLVISYFVKNWRTWQITVTALIAMLFILLITDQNPLISWHDKGNLLGFAIYLLLFIISGVFFCATYFLVRKYNNRKFQIGFD